MNWLKKLLGKKDYKNVSSTKENTAIDNKVESDFSSVERTETEATVTDTLKEKHDDKNAVQKNITDNKTAAISIDSMKVYHLIILDESGSMMPVRQQTVSGCNETIQTVRQMQEMNPDQRHFVSIYPFQTGRSRYVVKDKPVVKVNELQSQDYSPNSCTPLYDAIGYTLTDLKELLGEDVAAYVTIITDGYENDSHHFNLKMIRALIDEMKERKVVFSFIGAQIDSKEYGRIMGIDNTLQFDNDQQGTREMWERERMAKMRSSSKWRYSTLYANLDERKKFYNEENKGGYYDEQEDRSRITPSNITKLRQNEIFVFGSNIEGKHDGGASRYALEHFGAIYGQAEGIQGLSYAIPTVGVSEMEINEAVQRFVNYAYKHRDMTFLVTLVGCGNAGLTPYIIAPMFRYAVNLYNVKLPKEFWMYL